MNGNLTPSRESDIQEDLSGIRLTEEHPAINALDKLIEENGEGIYIIIQTLSKDIKKYVYSLLKYRVGEVQVHIEGSDQSYTLTRNLQKHTPKQKTHSYERPIVKVNKNNNT